MADFNDAKTIADAIKKLEAEGSEKASILKTNLEQEFTDLKKTVQDLKPYIDELKNKVENQLSETKSNVETKVKENPWIALLFTGLIAFAIGVFIKKSKPKDPQ